MDRALIYSIPVPTLWDGARDASTHDYWVHRYLKGVRFPSGCRVKCPHCYYATERKNDMEKHLVRARHTLPKVPGTRPRQHPVMQVDPQPAGPHPVAPHPAQPPVPHENSVLVWVNEVLDEVDPE